MNITNGKRVLLISNSTLLVTSNDNETAERAAFIYDALYASIKQSQTKP